MKNFGLACAAAFGIALSAPAAASTVVSANCQDLSAVGASCLFNGNINGNTNPGNANSHKNAQAAYNALSYSDITLDFLTASDIGGFSNFGSATGNGSSLTNSISGSWSLPGYSVQYLAVKAGSNFVLLNVGGVSGGNWDTLLIPYLNKNGKGNPKELSHLAFFGSQVQAAVPEPSTWALMILGFGAVGASLRRRKTSLRFV